MKKNRKKKDSKLPINIGWIRDGLNQWLLVILVLLFSIFSQAQYEDNPLKGKKWTTVSGGVNTMDFVSWQGMMSYSSRGETVLTQTRLAYSQELIKAPDDSCAEHRNRLIEAGLLWGDGWGKKKWYVTGAIGFGLNVRMYCDHSVYESRYLTAVTLGIPAQVEFGVMVSKKMGINVVAVGNWNFRAPYAGAHLGMFYLLK